MGILRVLAYPITKSYQMNARSRQLAFVYDIANRLVKELGYPKTIRTDRKKVPTYVVIGNKLMEEISNRGIKLKRASLDGPADEISEAIKLSLPGGESISRERLAALRVISPAANPLLSRYYDTFVPIKSVRALDILIKQESLLSPTAVSDRIHSI